MFAPGPRPDPVDFRGVRLGVPICEDIWVASCAEHLLSQGAELLLVPNGSPFEVDKFDQRLDLARRRVAETGLALVYLNQVGGQDELVFDGGSFVSQHGRFARASTPLLERVFDDDAVDPHERPSRLRW